MNKKDLVKKAKGNYLFIAFALTMAILGPIAIFGFGASAAVDSSGNSNYQVWIAVLVELFVCLPLTIGVAFYLYEMYGQPNVTIKVSEDDSTIFVYNKKKETVINVDSLLEYPNGEKFSKVMYWPGKAKGLSKAFIEGLGKLSIHYKEGGQTKKVSTYVCNVIEAEDLIYTLKKNRIAQFDSSSKVTLIKKENSFNPANVAFSLVPVFVGILITIVVAMLVEDDYRFDVEWNGYTGPFPAWKIILTAAAFTLLSIFTVGSMIKSLNKFRYSPLAVIVGDEESKSVYVYNGKDYVMIPCKNIYSITDKQDTFLEQRIQYGIDHRYRYNYYVKRTGPGGTIKIKYRDNNTTKELKVHAGSLDSRKNLYDFYKENK